MELQFFGKRLRHLRRSRGMTLDELGRLVERSPSQLSMLENGRREPKLSLLSALATALDVTTEDLLRPEPPSRRAELELALEAAQQDPVYAALGLPPLEIGARVPTEVLEHLIALYGELRRREEKPTATPEEARTANVELRQQMRQRGNHFSELERIAVDLLDKVGYRNGALSEGLIHALAGRAGYTLSYVADLPHSVRSIADLRNRRIFVRHEDVGQHSPRTIVLQALGHLVLGHAPPQDFADFLRQRVEANYFAAAALMPERSAVPFLQQAKAERDLAIEDLRDVFAVSYEMAAHRFTNLATHALDLTCHFVRNNEAGTIYKAYENDGLVFPADSTGAIEGRRMCRQWAGRAIFRSPDRLSTFYQYTDTRAATYWCVSHVDRDRERTKSSGGQGAVTVGVPYNESKWFRGRETTTRATSLCPDGPCCRRPELATRWEGRVWPSSRAHSHVLAALPPGTFPGVDETDLYVFLDRHYRGP